MPLVGMVDDDVMMLLVGVVGMVIVRLPASIPHIRSIF
jgi:hypothetical protein